MRKNPSLKFHVLILSITTLLLSLTPTSPAENRASRSLDVAASREADKPCPTCPQSIGLEAFRAAAGGELTPVIIELQEPAGIMKKLAAEQAGRPMPFEELIAHSATLQARQRGFIASLAGRGVRALLRETDARQIDGSVRRVQYHLTYLLNGFVAFVASEDLPRLRSLPDVKRVFELQPVRYFLDKAIDYSLGLQTNVADRRLAVYGPTLEFTPPGSSGHPEDPETKATDGFEGQGMIIAIIDSGVDWRHPMFGGTGQTTPPPHVSGQPETTNDNRKVIYYYALSSGGKPTDDFGHGTLVSSCAAGYAVDGNTPPIPGYGTGQNGTGIGPTPGGVLLHGMAPQARIMEYKVCGPANACLGDIELAIEDAASPFTLVGSSSASVTNTFIPKPVADVINLSLGDTTGDPASSTSVMANNAALAGTIVVAAAGNSGPGPGTIGSPGAATMAIAPAASLDPGSLSVADLLAANQITNETRSDLGGPPPETGAASDANVPQPGGRQTMQLFPAAGGGPIPQNSLSAHYVFVDRSVSMDTVPVAVSNRIALVKLASGSTFAQNANAVAPLNPAAILLITSVQSATALVVVNDIPTFTIGPDDANYLLGVMLTGVSANNVTNGAISELPLRAEASAPLNAFAPGMAGFSSRGPNGHPNARYRVIKPDVTAPGVSILGAAVPDGLSDATVGLSDPSGYVQASGTSFASPITAGTMALVRQRLRGLGLDATNFSLSNYRSTRFEAVTIARALLMNSASNLRSGLGIPEGDGTNSTASINDFGAGHINVEGALHANAVMLAPTLLLNNTNDPSEFNPPADTNNPPVYDSQGNLSVLLPSASFGAVPIVGVNGSIVLTQQVVLWDVTAGAGSGTYNLTIQNNRHQTDPGFQTELISPQGTPTNSITVLPGGRASFFVRVTAHGALINVDPTEFQWFITATHTVTGQKLRMPFYYRAVAPTILDITAPVLAQIQGDQAPQGQSPCAGDTNSSYTILWSYNPPNGGPSPAGFRVQEATRTTNIFFDDASTPLVGGANAIWSSSSPPAPAGSDWSSQVNTNTGRLAYYVPDSAQQSSSLFMANSLPIPPGSATLSFLTFQNLEDGFDSVYVEVSNDGGVSYSPVGSYMNDYIGKRIIDISQYAGQAIKVRFRMVSDTLNGPPDASPLGWFIQDITISSDDFHSIANLNPIAASLQVSDRPNGTFYYRVAGLFTTDLGNAPGPYSVPQCVTESIGVPIIASISILTNRHASLNCLGAAGVKHRIQAGTNLVNWINLATNTAAADGTFYFEDVNAPAIPYRFYRLVTP
jgi:subtilisin family serine protease